MAVDLLQLHYFRTVAKFEHMTRAAREIRIAQPALSKTIARLEEDLGVRLFDRHRPVAGRFHRHVQAVSVRRAGPIPRMPPRDPNRLAEGPAAAEDRRAVPRSCERLLQPMNAPVQSFAPPPAAVLNWE